MGFFGKLSGQSVRGRGTGAWTWSPTPARNFRYYLPVPPASLATGDQTNRLPIALSIIDSIGISNPSK